jgi:hypothetical protein
MVELAGAWRVAIAGELTLNVPVHVVTRGVQVLVYVKVTVVEPPHANGAPVLLSVKTPPQPPLAETDASQLLKEVLIADCDWHELSVTSAGQVSVTGVSVPTVKLDWQVMVWQVPVAVKVTVTLPPDWEGAPGLLLVIPTVQPPVDVTDASQVAYAALTAV